MDARLQELDLLVEIDRAGSITRIPSPGAEQDLLVFLASRGYVNDLNVSWQHYDDLTVALPGESELERVLHRERILTLSRILAREAVPLRITHAGRVRIAELRSAFTSSRVREQLEILWDGRHFETDLGIALLEASAQAPVAVGFLDLNGMKAVNDIAGHEAGDLVMRAYFHAVNTAVSGQGDAYRIGGDEVGLVLPNCSQRDAIVVVRRASQLLERERLKYNGVDLPSISVAAGLTIVTTTKNSPEDLKRLTDKAMYRAKAFTFGRQPRPSSLSLDEEELVQVIE